ncbi:MAG: hypothetical protein JW867_05265 [Candidatus Omnitrophica bacterium]|nr:hypothetical protein [Candidatus Omnitrophota bacterium]
MIYYTCNYQILISAIALGLFILCEAINYFNARAIKRQSFIEYPKRFTDLTNEYRNIFSRFIFVLFIFGVAWCLGGYWFDFFAGGYVVSTWINVVIALNTLWQLISLRNQDAAQGKISYSLNYIYKYAAYRLIAMGLLTVGIFILIDNTYFLGASLLLFSSGLGYYRKSLKDREKT